MMYTQQQLLEIQIMYKRQQEITVNVDMQLKW